MFIYVGCAGGMTSSMFCQRIVRAIETLKSPLTAVFEDVGTIIRRKKEFEGNYDLVFAYGGIDFISPVNAYDFGTTFDVVFVSPQVRHMTKYKREILEDYPTIVEDIGMKTFGTMNGEVAYENLLEELIALDYQRSSTSGKHPETKNGDKNIELLVLGADRNDAFFKSFFSVWEAAGLRVLTGSYSLEALFDFKPEKDFDIRVLFGNTSQLSSDEFPKLSRRIDGVLAVPFANSSFEKIRHWFEDYAIPVYVFDSSNLAIKKGEPEAHQYASIFDEIVANSEYTRENSPPQWETPPPKKQRKSTLFGLVSWE
ncbi:PTS sugar transporter subunit IIB [Enterococcus sp. LJL51]|uniref:PTS sugar transporter subunit IIB n=1 Tax=Enterococcus sp. LJL51 TaxID=3416656 RepID=UPI003CEF02CE